MYEGRVEAVGDSMEGARLVRGGNGTAKARVLSPAARRTSASSRTTSSTAAACSSCRRPPTPRRRRAGGGGGRRRPRRRRRRRRRPRRRRSSSASRQVQRHMGRVHGDRRAGDDCRQAAGAEARPLWWRRRRRRRRPPPGEEGVLAGAIAQKGVAVAARPSPSKPPPAKPWRRRRCRRSAGGSCAACATAAAAEGSPTRASTSATGQRRLRRTGQADDGSGEVFDGEFKQGIPHGKVRHTATTAAVPAVLAARPTETRTTSVGGTPCGRRRRRASCRRARCTKEAS